MPRLRTLLSCWIICVLPICGAEPLGTQGLPPSEALLPKTTQGFFAVSSIERLNEHWQKTQLGHLMADPVMKPFAEDVRRQFEDRWSSVHERLGLTLQDMQGVPGGDVGIGLISPEPGKAALAIVVDVSGKRTQAEELLEKVKRTQSERGAKITELEIEGCPDKVIQLDLPALESEKEADRSELPSIAAPDEAEQKTDEQPQEEKEGKTTSDAAEEATEISIAIDDTKTGDVTADVAIIDDATTGHAETDDCTKAKEGDAIDGDQSGKPIEEPPEPASETPEPESGQPVPDAAEPAARQAFYCLTGNLLIVADDLDVLKGILMRRTGEADDSLADHKPFQAVMERCRSDHGQDEPPQMRWYLSPLAYAETTRAATSVEHRRKGKSVVEIMRNQGVEAVQGIGGLADFSSEGFELVHRTAVYAPKPYRNAMKMLVMPNREDFAPQSWVPDDIATYTTLYFDILNAFDNFGSLFDELVGQGTRGAWEDTKDSLKLDPNGPQVDLRADLIAHLGERVSMLTDYQTPITTTSERLLFSIEVKDSEAVAAAIARLLQDDPTVRRRERAGHVIWEVVGEEAQTPTMEFDFGDVPPVAPARPRSSPWDDEEEEEDTPKRLFPHAAVTVCKDHLFVASHIDFLLKIISPETEPKLLKDDEEYKLVASEIRKLGPEQNCFRFFSRTDEEYRPTYELIRQNKMPESETMLARMLNVLFGEGKKGVPRKQKIDGRQLPEYEAVSKYLGPAGMQVTSEKDGWFLKGFTLTKEAE